LLVRNKGKHFVILLTFTFSGIEKERQKQPGIYPYYGLWLDRFEMMKYTTNMIILLLLAMANQYEQSIK
jgi:hypothetical protein